MQSRKGFGLRQPHWSCGEQRHQQREDRVVARLGKAKDRPQAHRARNDETSGDPPRHEDKRCPGRIPGPGRISEPLSPAGADIRNPLVLRCNSNALQTLSDFAIVNRALHPPVLSCLHHGSQRIDSHPERIRYGKHLRVVRKVGLEEIVGLGNTSHVWRGGIG